jgi:hypothetical protein
MYIGKLTNIFFIFFILFYKYQKFIEMDTNSIGVL